MNYALWDYDFHNLVGKYDDLYEIACVLLNNPDWETIYLVTYCHPDKFGLNTEKTITGRRHVMAYINRQITITDEERMICLL